MKKKQIMFTAPRIAELQEREVPEVGADGVLAKMEYTVVSGGTERANLLAVHNTSQEFPKSLGYCGVGYVEAIGENVKSVKVGDRVLVYHGCHASYNIRKENEITKVTNGAISSLDAAFVIIAAMGLGGMRKLELELGESAMVLGLGLLGIFAVQFCRLGGGHPVIAVDPNPSRRELALSLGADYALDPTDADFANKVKELTHGKGVNAIVEVTGSAKALEQALECAAWMGRISLLGCTRVSDCNIDYYQQVHRPGIKLIGAHNLVRPKLESYPHHWTHQDDCKCILDMIASGRVKVAPIVSRVVDPAEAPRIFTELCDDPMFPIGTVFDWRNY